MSDALDLCMRTALRHVALLGAISSAVTAAACSKSSGDYVVRSETKSVDVVLACQSMGVTGTTKSGLSTLAARGPGEGVACGPICGEGFNDCAVDSIYANQVIESRNDAGERTCPSTPTGKVTVTCREVDPDNDPCPRCVGRRPDGLTPMKGRQASALAQYFAENAHLEAAAVLAFDHMVLELTAHGAPSGLVRAAKIARADEARHAEMTASLARRFGATPPPAVATPSPVRSIYEMALENEVEGIVRETFGAAVAEFRARHAEDPEMRSALSAIARDEGQHAVLSRALGEWFRTKLGAGDRARLDAARREAIVDLKRSITRDPHADVRRIAGEPLRTEMQAMIDALERSSLRS